MYYISIGGRIIVKLGKVTCFYYGRYRDTDID